MHITPQQLQQIIRSHKPDDFEGMALEINALLSSKEDAVLNALEQFSATLTKLSTELLGK
ncbi:MAG TPA: hypothetical protein VN577_09985 [Terriglobales bacterium]|nr:hypothetical protein [Terriglobales bacterium]